MKASASMLGPGSARRSSRRQPTACAWWSGTSASTLRQWCSRRTGAVSGLGGMRVCVECMGVGFCEERVRGSGLHVLHAWQPRDSACAGWCPGSIAPSRSLRCCTSVAMSLCPRSCPWLLGGWSPALTINRVTLSLRWGTLGGGVGAWRALLGACLHHSPPAQLDASRARVHSCMHACTQACPRVLASASGGERPHSDACARPAARRACACRSMLASNTEKRKPAGDAEYCARVGARSPKQTRWVFEDDKV